MRRASDTSAEAARVQLELLRNASTERRLTLALSLSATAMTLSRHGLRASNPSFTDEELGLAFVKHHYGEELASRVRAYLAGRR